MAGIEVRELECFLAVAQERHLGRAARRLSVVQPALSRTVQKLEPRLAVRLFDP